MNHDFAVPLGSCPAGLVQLTSRIIMAAPIHTIGAPLSSYIWRDGTLYPAILLSTLLHLLDLSVMLLLIMAAFLLKRYGTQAIPLAAPTTTATFEAPIFARDNPSDGCHSRTVLDILWSCLATTFACTWVSVHPNVPFKGEGQWTLLRRRIFLMFFSILAPEFMIMWAFKQWRGAVMIREAMNDAISQASPDKANPVRKLWTTAHGHFMQMGGFRLRTLACENFYVKGSSDLDLRRRKAITALACYENDNNAALCLRDQTRYDELPLGEDGRVAYIASQNRNLIPNYLHYRHETSKGLWVENISEEDASGIASSESIWEGVLSIDALRTLLAENLVQFPTITEDEINDKSKGDALSKGFALIQLTWFTVQIITRAVRGLAITELELTTAALAGLNSVMYIFCWSKPRDVRFPVVIRTKGVEELLAKRHAEDVAWSFSDQEFDIRKHLWASLATWTRVLLDAACHFIVSLPSQLISILLRSAEHVKTLPLRLTFTFSRDRSLLLRTRQLTTRASEGEMLLAVHDEPPRKFENRIKRYALMFIHGAKSAMKAAFVPFFCLIYIIDVVLFIPIAKILKSDVDDGSISGKFLHKVGGLDVETEETIFTMIFYSEDAGVKPLLSTSSIAGALFGAVHCLAWHFSFPSYAEQILCRTASVGIVGSCAVTFQTVLFYRQDADAFWEYVAGYLTLFGVLLCGLASFIYPVARITLLVLAITSLRSLPSSAFDTVDWIDFAPHI